jgi:hypothetical protein
MNTRFKGHGPLMMFYLLPEEIVARTNLTDFPRDPYKALDDPKWREVYESDYFQLVLTDAWAWLIWDYLGVRGGMEQYSGYDPIWQLAHAYTYWMLVFFTMGLKPERYFNLEPGDMLRYLTREETDATISDMMTYFMVKSTFRQWRDAVLEHRAHEDYDTRRSSVKVDFHRKWYHTRAKVKVDDIIQAGEEPSYYPEDGIISRLDSERFTDSLEYKNQRIVKLLLAGYTQAEIGKILGFANHSGVNKRIKKIGEAYLEYIKP